MNPRASRIADIVASVPLETSRTCWTGVRVDDQLGELDLAGPRRAERGAAVDRLLHGIDDLRVPVSEDHRPPRADEVDVPAVVGVPEVGALAADHEARGAADGTEGAHR